MSVRIANVLWLVVVWLAVIESVTVGAVLAGVLVALALMALFPTETQPGRASRIRPLGLCRFVAYFASQLVRANVQVAWAVLAPSRSRLRRGIIAVPVAETSWTATTMLAAAVSLTPGTSIIELREGSSVFYVHVLQLTSVDAVRLEVTLMQRSLVRAIGPADALEEIDQRIADLRERLATDGKDRPWTS